MIFYIYIYIYITVKTQKSIIFFFKTQNSKVRFDVFKFIYKKNK